MKVKFLVFNLFSLVAPSRGHALFLMLGLIAFSASASANRVNGVASHQALNVEQFIAALYTATPTPSADSLLSGDTAARMEIRVTRPYISQRRFMTMWLESITVNNSSAAVQKQMDNLARFNQMFKGRVLAGDRIVFDYAPAKGMDVSLNGVELGNISSGDFFRLLLSCWVGDVPLSSDLKTALLSPNAIDQVVLERFNKITPTFERRDAIVAWWTSPAKDTPVADESVTQPAVQPTAEVAAKPPAPKPAVKPKPVTKPAPKPVAKPSPKPAESIAAVPAAKGVEQVAKADALPVPAKKPVEQKRDPIPKAEAASVNTEVVDIESEKEKSASEAEAKAKPARGGQSILAQLNPQAQSTGSDDEPEGEDETMRLLDAGGLLARQQYYELLTNHLVKYQKIPRQAYQRKLEDEVRVYVTIDRNGNLMAVELERESKYKMFNKQALEAVDNALPFPAMPASIDGQTFSFSVLLTYRLPI